MRAVVAVKKARARNLGLVYAGVSGGKGLLIDALLVRLASRGLNCATIVHHHNYSYLDYESRWMRAFVRANPNVTHLLLCEDMRQQFVAAYDVADEHAMVVGNYALRMVAGEKALIDDRPRVEAANGSRVRVGYLGALSADKGFDTFARASEMACSRLGGQVEFVCAGEVADSSSRELLDQVSALTYLGILDELEVMGFLASIDVLLFPSRLNEAQPNVIVECLSIGVPVVATRQGCIPNLMSPNLSGLVAGPAEFLSLALGVVESCVDPDRLAALRRSALAQRDVLVTGCQAERALWESLISHDGITDPTGCRG